MKNVVYYILSAQKKIFVMAFLAVFSSFYTVVWGVDTWKKGGVKIVSSGSTLTVSAIDPEGVGERGVMGDYVDFDGSSSPKRPPQWSSGFTTIIVEEGVKTIGAYAFQGISNITTIKLPASLTTIRTDAFKGCTGVATFYYAGSPTDWASKVTFSNLTAHPCGARTLGTDYHFYGYSTPRTDLLIIEPTITEINPYAFYRIYLHSVSAGSGLAIPGTVTKIGTKAFYGATINGEITVNKKNAPTLETDALNTSSTGLTVYVPDGASEYTSAKGWNRFSTVSEKPISGNDVGSEIETTTNITWNLNESGVLTLNATGATKTISGVEAAAKLPWRYFRRVVYIVKLQGEISAIGNMLHYNFGLGGIDLDQITIPSVSATYIATSSSTAYSALANPLNNLALRVKVKTLFNATEKAKFSSAPWNDGKWDIGLSEPALFDQGQNNEALVDSINKYIELPISLQLRSISNAYNNTFCSPVTLTKAQAKAIWGDATEIHRLSSTSIENDKLTLVFSEIGNADMEAGYPYLIWPENNVAAPIVEGVDPSNIEVNGVDDETDYITFHGILEPKTISQEEIDNQSVIFLTGTIVDGKQQLTWANGGTLNGMRAYWKVKEGTPASVMAKRPVLQIGNGENTTTDLGQVPSDKIQCTKVLRNGQIYILRGEKAYNLQGIEIDRPNKL